jgi:hypothetical protein
VAKLEAKLSAPFMKDLRSLPGSRVVKHSDGSMIGMVDCSLTWGGRTLWMEFKADLLDDPIEGLLGDDDLLAALLMRRHTKDAETQHQMALDLDSTSVCLYVFWVKQTCVLLVRPSTMEAVKVKATGDAVALVKRFMSGWKASLSAPAL